LKRSIRFLSSKRLLSPASVSATLLVFPNDPFLDHVALAFVRGSSNGLPWAAPTSRQRGVLSTIQSQSPAAAIALRAFPRAHDASLRAQIRPPVSTVIFLLLYRVLLFRLFPVRASSSPYLRGQVRQFEPILTTRWGQVGRFLYEYQVRLCG
jgi:hypothetical protein